MPDNQWILTYTGRKFYPLAPRIDDIHIDDIAHALSNMCRFTGHIRQFYSVAQHSVHVATLVYARTNEKRIALKALLHDASEAYLCDIARPVKHAPEFEFYRESEKQLQYLIYEKFGLLELDEKEIKIADEEMLHVETYNLMPNHREWDMTYIEPKNISVALYQQNPLEAKLNFIKKFRDYTDWSVEEKLKFAELHGE